MDQDKDKENIIPLSEKLERVRHPSKSILKDNTLPILNNKRRVSFAPEVTLHKFDFVPYGISQEANSAKRRRTISGLPSLRFENVEFIGSQESQESERDEDNDDNVDLTPDHGLEILEDSEDSSDDSDTFLETEADQVVQGMELLESRDLEIAREVQDNYQKTEHAVETNVEKESDLERPPNVIDDEEHTMELTGQIQLPMSSYRATQQISSFEDNADKELSSSEDEVEDGSDMELTEVQKSHPVSIPQPIQQNEEDREVTMDVTQVYSIPSMSVQYRSLSTVEEASEPSTETESTKDFDIERQKTDDRPFVVQTESDDSVAKEIGESNSEIHETLPNETEDEVYTMEITQAVSTITRTDQQDDRTMEFTQIVSNITPITSQTGESNHSESRIVRTENEEQIEENERANSSNVQHMSSFTQEKIENLNQQLQSETLEGHENGTDLAADEAAGSQPMELTQTTHSIESNNSSTMELPADFSATNPEVSGIGLAQEFVSTTKIPLAEVSQIESGEEDDYVPVSLNDFMNDISVKFYDDLDIDVDTLNRLSVTSTTDMSAIHLKHFVSALPRLELLALYQFSCEELSKNIKDGREMFLQYSKTIEVNNPILFREYYSTDGQERQILNSKLQIIKDYVRFESRKTWYNWRTLLTTNLIAELDEKHRILAKDKTSLKEDILRINDVITRCQLKFSELKSKVVALKSIKAQLSQVTIEEATAIRNELGTISTQLAISRESLLDKRKQLTELDGLLLKTKEIKLKLDTSVNDHQITVLNNKRYEQKELIPIRQKFKILQLISKLSFQKITGSRIAFEFDNACHCEFDFKELTNASDASYSIGETENLQLFNSELLSQHSGKLNTLIQGDNVLDSFKSFSRLWKSLKQVDFDIYRISLRYPIKWLQSEDSILFEVRYFNPTKDYKLVLTCELKLQDLWNYQRKTSLKGFMLRSSSLISDDAIKSDILEEFNNNNLVSLHSIESIQMLTV
ncbi:Spc7 kinetochore protein-domain-containing protein [Scheffersomyces xylosifermentans]|uniref:Spc7 kinetochore protein-domain-containing protein n=1 Tax=Scheffersomyces xylosifermentans TaxID=1304137 RepID=UPI00315DC6AB